MLDWLAVWGVTSAVGLVFKPILEDLAKDATKDWAKDLMKDSLKNVLRLPSKEPVDIAAGKALKEFLQLVQDELEDADLSEAGLKQYIKPLKQFIKDKSVKEILGNAFKDDCQVLDAATLAKTWNQLNLRSLPDEFEWERVAKRYLKKVKALVRESDELRALLDSQKLEAIEQNTKELAGIVTEFDLERYQEGLRERYGNLNLDSLDTSVYDYREKLKVWQVFIAQNVRECQEFLPQVYEIPKDHQKRLRESNQLEAEVDPEAWERYKQIYYQQPVRSVLDIVNEMWVEPPQPPLLRGENLEPPQPPLLRGEQDSPSLGKWKEQDSSSLRKREEQDSSSLRKREEQYLATVPPLSKGGLGGVNAGCNNIVILGDPGSGKSTLLQYIALNWARTPLNNVISQPIPLLIELRTYIRDRTSGQCKDFLEFFHKGSVICRLNQHELHEQLKAGKILVMFDGLDEVFDPAQREEVITDIHRFTNDYPNVRVIVTSRIIGYKPQRLRDAQFRHFMLQDLESEQIQDFIYRWHELTFTDEADKVRKRERLQQAIKTSSAIGELAGNPLLLTMMAILNRNQELPRDRPELYNQASRVLLHQWDVEQKLLENPRIDSVAIDYKDKQAMLRQVAYHMQAADKGLAGHLIRGNDLERILTGYLKSIEVSQARTVARLLIEQLRSRNFILCFLGADSYGFVHRTFLEYFCACEFVERFGKRGLEGGLTLEELKTEVFGKHWQDESWHEVLRLISGMIDTKFAGEIIEYLMSQDGEAQKFINLFLGAKCLSEVRNCSVLEITATQLLHQLKSLTRYDLNYYYEPYRDQKETSLVREIRTKAVAAVVMTWKDDPETLAWLKTCAQSDEDWRVREVAVKEIARGWKDNPNTLPWLKTIVQSDDVEWVQKAAIEELVRGWKNQSDTLPWLKTLAQSGGIGWVAVKELARGWKNDPETLLIIKTLAQFDSDWYIRGQATEELAQGWKDDPDTLTILKSHALSDENWKERVSSMTRLVNYGWKDNPNTLSILKTQALSDEDWHVRKSAVMHLVAGWKDDPESLPLLKTLAQSDGDWNVRRQALYELLQGWKDDPQILPILKTCALLDIDWRLRHGAVEALALGWKDEPWMFEFLYNRILNDPFERKEDREDNPRQLGLEIIIKQYRDRPQTLPLLQDRAENDPDEKVRAIARENLEYFKGQN